MKQQQQRKDENLDAALRDIPADEGLALREVWHKVGAEEPTTLPEGVEVEKVWHVLEAAALGEPVGSAPSRGAVASRRRRRVPGRQWVALAAVLLVGVAIGVWTLRPRTNIVMALPGERLSLQLPDGSHIDLNSGSTLRYARSFADERIVHLVGEAFFDVVEDDHPFIVHTFNAQVTVLGTRFNVRAWPASMTPVTTLALESGRVSLAPRERLEEAVVLVSGQTHRVSSETGIPSPPDSATVADALSWKQGDLVFKDQRLGVVLEDIERRFAVEVSLSPRTLGQERWTFVWRNPAGVEDVIRDVCVALGLSYRETSIGYEMYAP